MNIKHLFPRVTAVLCTGLPGRAELAVASARSFFAQNHPNRALLIFNHSLGEPHEFRLRDLLPPAPPDVDVQEVLTRRLATLGDMRSAALECVSKDTDYVVQWDDDDWSHPVRITRQLNALKSSNKPLACCVLGCQVRYSVRANTAYKHVNSQEGIAGTIMHPHDGNRYPPMETSEDATFLKRHYINKNQYIILLDRKQPELYIRFFHGSNISAEEHVMRNYANPRWKGCWLADSREGGYLPVESREYLLKVLVEEYGRTELPGKLQTLHCTKCDRSYYGEIFYRTIGEKRFLQAPHDWRRVWVKVEEGASRFLGVCYRCRP